MAVDIDADYNLDITFAEIGEFSVFQIFNIFLICIPTILSGAYMVDFIFSATTLNSRCKVPECDIGENNRDMIYDQPWLSYAIPPSKDGFDNCVRYAPKNASTAASGYECSADLFDTSKTIKCSEFVYTSDENNIQTEFNIHCEDSYKLALVGTVNNLGRFIFLPLTGLLSDRFGRLRVIVISVLICSIFGLVKSFSISYGMYITMEFLEASAGTCIFGVIYILTLEWVSSKYRPLGTTLICTSFSLGEMLLGLVAMHIHDFRIFLRVIYIPGLFVLSYFWLVPESTRWLLVTGRVDEAIKILKRNAAVNRKTLSEKSIELIRTQYSPEAINAANQNAADDKLSLYQQIRLVLGSKKLALRLMNCCFLWMACCFCYYGMSLISTHIPGENRYISYIMVQAVEIPGATLPVIVLSRFKRKKLLFSGLTLTGIAITIAPWIPADKSIIMLLLFMVGKAAITFAFNVLYIFSAELWPTNLRTTIMNSCSMNGRVGAMIAPLTTLLIVSAPNLPYLLFGTTAIIAACFVLLLPETFLKKLPDNIEDAKKL